MSHIVLCSQCKKEITTTNYVKCYNCNSNYHFSTCSPLSESTYLSMYGERKTSWKCHICKPRSRSPNTLYQAVVFDDNNNKKQARTDDDDENAKRDQTKKFKESMSTTSANSKLCAEIDEFRTDMKEMKNTMNSFVATANNAIATITQTINTLTEQVKDLHERDKKRDDQICKMEKRINKLEQQMLCKNIEIKNITNTQMSAYDVVKAIGTSINININKEDVHKAYRIKKQNNKIIVEFSTLSKKEEFMNKIVRHRVDSKSININEENNVSQTPKYIYINDELTFNNRRLLWLAKIKAKEANWKFVWVRNGNIFARKNDNSPFFTINNTADIESISNTV